MLKNEDEDEYRILHLFLLFIRLICGVWFYKCGSTRHTQLTSDTRHAACTRRKRAIVTHSTRGTPSPPRPPRLHVQRQARARPPRTRGRRARPRQAAAPLPVPLAAAASTCARHNVTITKKRCKTENKSHIDTIPHTFLT